MARAISGGEGTAGRSALRCGPSTRLTSTFTADNDRYVDDCDRRQQQQHERKDDWRTDHVHPDREGCAQDQTEHSKPEPQRESANGWRGASDPRGGVVVAG